MNKPTKQCHWVPRAYLKSFSVPEYKKPKIWRFSRFEGEPELKPISKVAVRHHLYVPLKEDGLRDDSFEKRLSELERWFGEPLWDALCNDFVDLGWPPMRKIVALLLSVMMLRNPKALNKFEQIHKNLKDAISKQGRVPHSVLMPAGEFLVDKSSWKDFYDSNSNDIKTQWLQTIGNAADFAVDLLSMRWAMLFSESPVFVTSDSPVTITHPSLRFRGIGNPETSILFPISPYRMLHLDHLMSEPDNQYYPAKHEGALENLLVFREANEYIFSATHPDVFCSNLVKLEEDGVLR